jgi:hypothetical protein
MATFAELFNSPRFASPADSAVKCRVGGKDGHKFTLVGSLGVGPRDAARVQLVMEQVYTVKVTTPWTAGESGTVEDSPFKLPTPTMLAASLAHVTGVALPNRVKPVEEQLATPVPEFQLAADEAAKAAADEAAKAAAGNGHANRVKGKAAKV